MSKRTKKTKASPADATAKPPSDPSSLEARPVCAQASAETGSADTPAPVHSTAPTTDDIDDDWSNSVAPAANVAASAAGASAATTSSDKPTVAKSDEVKPAQQTGTLSGPTIHAAAPSPDVAVAAPHGAPEQSGSRPRSLASSAGMHSVIQPQPATRKATRAAGTPILAGEGVIRPVAVPVTPSISTDKAVPPTIAAPRAAPQKDEAGSPPPPVVRAVVLPPLVDVPVPARNPKASSESPRKAELELAQVPVTRAAAAAIVEPPAPLELELSEVAPGDSGDDSSEDLTDVAPPPPDFLMENLASTDDELADVPEEELEALSAEDSGLNTGIPSSGEVTVPEVTAPLTELPADTEASVALPAIAQATATGSAVPTEPVIPLLTDLGPSKPISILPTVPVTPRSEGEEFPIPRKTRSRAPMVLLWLFTAIAPATTVWWFMRVPAGSAAARCSETADNNQILAERVIARAAMPEPATPVGTAPASTAGDPGVPLATSADTPLSSASASPEPASSGETPPNLVPSSTAAVPSDQVDAAASASASPAESAPPDKLPVVVETDSKDRVSVVLKSEPMGARVLRMDKEIGRTPLTIQIGRGERRVFVLSAAGFGYKRFTLDDAKPELLVDLSADGKDGKDGSAATESTPGNEVKAAKVPKAPPYRRPETKVKPPPGHTPPTASFD